MTKDYFYIAERQMSYVIFGKPIFSCSNHGLQFLSGECKLFMNPSDLNCSLDELDEDYPTVLSTVGNN